MEYELLNSMLTVSVSNLFINNRLKHIKYFMSEDIGEKVDIPKSSTRKREEDLGISLAANNKPQAPSSSIEQWRNKDSKKKLSETMTKLGINESKIGETDLCSFSLEYLENEKSKIKKELQELDKDFFKQFNRMPEKNEKEIYRPLYIYYRELKSAIEAKKSGKPLKQKSNKEVSSKEKEKKTESTKEISIKNDLNQKESSKRSQSSSTLEPKKDSEYSTKNIREDQGGMLLSQDEAQYKGRSASAKNKRYTNFEIEEFKKELESLKKIQLEYKEKLHDYQMDFLKKNNRKVKFYKDIIEVEFEYNAYKENRVKIRDIEEILANNLAKV